MSGKDYYKILGVPRTASTEDLKKAYKRLARKYHPDLNAGDKQAESKFKEISEAYAVLGNEAKRKEYDHVGPSGFRFDPRDFRNMGTQFDFDLGGFDLRGVFDSFFGGGRPGRGFGSSPGYAPQGGDLEYTLELDFEQAVHGYTAPINVNGELINVKIPPGVDNGSRVRVKGKGAASPFGGPRGDLYIRVIVRPHPVFERRGKDLFCKVPVTFPEAALGGAVNVPTLGGATRIRIPAGTSSGKVFRISAKGVPSNNGTGPGDLYAEVQIVVPRELKGHARELVEELGRALSGAARK